LSSKIELLIKVFAWRFFSMCYAFFIALAFTHKVSDSFGIVVVTGTSLTFVQWIFEVFWDRQVRGRLGHAISGQQCRIDRVVRWRRDARLVRVDKHKQGADRGEAGADPAASQDAR
jgi:uncharacterized membrane protein